MHFYFSFILSLVGCVCINVCVYMCVCTRACMCVYNVTLESDFVGSTSYLITEYKLESEVRLGNCDMTAPLFP